MKNILIVLSVILFSCNAPAQKQDVDASAFEKDLNNNNAQLLDVRTPEEYQAGHIKNALLANWMDQNEFTDRVKYLDKEKPVLVYCASGGRSSKASQWLSSNGFAHVENLTGGFTEWKLENKPVEAASNVPQMTIDEYYAVLKSDEPVLVEFGAEWCPPCRGMQPVLDALQAENNKFKLVKVDGMNTALMQQLDVKELPTFIVYKNGKETWRKQGIVEKDELKKELGK
jgi:rhodanese-related sulfurtransferase